MVKTSSPPKRFTEILDAAAHVFAEKGFHGASTKDIADRLGIQQAGVYYYFKSKDAMLADVCRLGVQGYVEHAVAISKSDQPAATKLRLAIREHLLPFFHIRHHTRVFHAERRYLVGEAREQVKKLAARYERELRGIVKQGIANGELRKDLDAKLATLALLGMCNSVSVWYDGKSEAEINKIADTYADVIVNGVTK